MSLGRLRADHVHDHDHDTSKSVKGVPEEGTVGRNVFGNLLFFAKERANVGARLRGAMGPQREVFDGGSRAGPNGANRTQRTEKTE